MKVSWRQEDNKLYINIDNHDFFTEVPSGYNFNETDPYLVQLAEYLLLYGLSYNNKIGNYEVPKYDYFENNINRKKNDKIGLCYSNGIDSAAALLLLPPEKTIPIYIYRSFDDKYNMNALNGINKLEKCIILKSDFEKIRQTFATDKIIGFCHGYGYASILCLLADFLNIGSFSLGALYQTLFISSANKFVDIIDKNRPHGSFFMRTRSYFNRLNIDLCLPVGALSEIATGNIVKQSHLNQSASSCQVLTDDGNCYKCFKCFRNFGRTGYLIDVPQSIEKLLEKNPLKLGPVTMYAVQKCGYSGKLTNNYLNGNFQFVEKYYEDCLEDFIEDPNVRNYVISCYKKYNIEPMNENDLQNFKNIEFVFNNINFE